MRRAILRAACLVLILATGAGEAFAQQQDPSQKPRPLPRKKPVMETPVAPQKTPPPPASAQEKPLIELSEVFGSLAFITQICSPATHINPWRTRMETLLATEGESSGARDRMTGAFNRSFSEYSTSYRQCTEAAEAARLVLQRDAAQLAREIERRFGS
jgi:uncharacterized protein (TIGR02301 family)